MFAANADIYSPVITKRPAVTLDQACKIAHVMLASKNDEKRFYITNVSLIESKNKQDKSRCWSVWHNDKDGNMVDAQIVFPTGICKLYYYPVDREKNKEDKTVNFDTAANLLNKHKQKANKAQ